MCRRVLRYFVCVFVRQTMEVSREPTLDALSTSRASTAGRGSLSCETLTEFGYLQFKGVASLTTQLPQGLQRKCHGVGEDICGIHIATYIGLTTDGGVLQAGCSQVTEPDAIVCMFGSRGAAHPVAASSDYSHYVK